ncbi:MAG: diacylglycerol kinase family protein [bacterium]|nr:diacylglycerol kinase family protein [bacterium]
MSLPPRFLQSSGHALRGIAVAVRHERHVRIELVAFTVVLFLGFLVRLQPWEWIAILLVSSFVLVVELVNSAVEYLLDLLKPRLHDYARDVKDVLAGAVFLAAFVAVVVGCIIFLPYLS